MGHSSFGPMWPTRNPFIKLLVRSDGLKIPVHQELLGLTALLMDLTELMGYDIRPGATWGYAYRPIAGTNPPKPSNHSQGTADDLNADTNPQATAAWHKRNARGTFPFGLQVVCDIPENVLQLWEDYGYRLGVKYKAPTKIDPMHVEFMGSVADARRNTERLRAWIADHGGTDPSPKENPDMKSLVVCIASEEHELPAAIRGGAWWWVDGGTRAWCPTEECALVAFQLGQADASTPRAVSAHFIQRLRPVHPIDSDFSKAAEWGVPDSVPVN